MTLVQIQNFEVLARLRHYTRAAESLHISQPSLSYSINELEKELGVKLFEREIRQVCLTPYGERFVPYVQKALQLLKDGANVLDQMRGAAPMVVRMGYFHSLSSSLIPTIVSDFYQKQDGQKLRFQFVEDTSFDIFSQLKERKLDLAFCTNRGEWADSVTILKQPLYLAVSLEHPLAKRSIVSFADYAREPLIVLDSGNSLRAQLDRAFQERGMIPNIVFEVRECNAALQYVALNFGVALLPMVPAMRSERVCAIPVEENGEALVRAVFLSWNREYPLSPPAQLVRNFIVQRYAAAMPA